MRTLLCDAPSSSTMSSSAPMTVVTRWEMMSLVTPERFSPEAGRGFFASVSLSTAERESSKTSTGRPPHEGAGNGYALLLPAREGDAALPHFRCISFGEGFDMFVHAGKVRCTADGVFPRFGGGDRDIFPDRARKEEALLQYKADRAPHRRGGKLGDIPFRRS